MKRSLIMNKCLVIGGILVCVLMAFLSPAWASDLTVVYGDWKEAIAKTYMLKYILEENVGIKVELKRMTVEEMWKGVAEGTYDAMVCATLPEQQAYYNKHARAIVDLGPNWMGENKVIHTIVRKGLQEEAPALARFLNNYCLCGPKLDSVMALLKGETMHKKEALKWMKDHEDWVKNMMGLCQGFELRDWS